MSAKVRKIIGILDRIRVKYLFSAAALLLFAQLVFGSSVPRGMLASAAEDSLRQRLSDSLRIHSEAAAEVPEAATQSRRDRREQARAAREQARRRAAFEALPQEQLDSLITQKGDSLEGRGADTIARDTVKEKKPQKPGAFLDDPISGKNKDSLVYDVRNKMVYIYNEGDITYQNSNLKADYMQINMDNKMVYAYGKPDSLEGKPIVTKPEFSEGDASYTMDTITYNLTSKKAKIKGVATQQGDGWLVGGSVKKMPDNTVNIENGKYTTCDETDHPHFYLAMTKAKVIPGKKVVTGPAYLVMEDVPIYFLGIPEGFFPINMGPKSGLLMPTYGEEYSKGFFLRDLGYYFTLGEYADLAALVGALSPLLFDTGLLAAPYPKLFRRRTLGGLRFDDRLQINEDVLFNIQFLQISSAIYCLHGVYYKQYDTESGSLSRRLRGDLLDAERITRPALAALLRKSGLDPAPYEHTSRLRACLNQYGLLTGCRGDLPYARRRALFAEILADNDARAALQERLRNDPNKILAVPYRIGVAWNWPGLLAAYTLIKQRLL